MNYLAQIKAGRIAIHLLCYAKGIETWERCKAGIAREFYNYKKTLQVN